MTSTHPLALLGLATLLLGSTSATLTAQSSGDQKLVSLIYSTVATQARTPSVQVRVGTFNGSRGTRAFIAESPTTAVDTSAEAAQALHIAGAIHEALPKDHGLTFISIGWGVDTGPGSRPTRSYVYDLPSLSRHQ